MNVFSQEEKSSLSQEEEIVSLTIELQTNAVLNEQKQILEP